MVPGMHKSYNEKQVMFERYQVFQVIVLFLTERITLLGQDMSTLKTIVKEVSCQSFRDL